MIDEDDLIENNWPVCPYCGYEDLQHDALIDEEYIVYCPNCNCQYAVYKHIAYTYTTSRPE